MKAFKKYETTMGVHDPTIIYHEASKTYYMYSTDTKIDETMTLGIPIRKSKDLYTWEYVGTALNGIPNWVYTYTQAKNLWAPEVIKIKDQYRMYYSASQFGTNISCIGLAEAKHPEGPWIDKGLVYSSHPDKNDANAIDANVLYDKHGDLWFVYGSFFSGIYIKKLDETTGKLVDPTTQGTCISNRPINVEGAIEGPYIYYHQAFDMYYLFTSYDFLGRNYNIRVARSKNIEGPYLDVKGHGMFGKENDPNNHGTKILGSYHIKPQLHWTSIGHNSILDIKDKQFIVAHTRIQETHYPHFLHLKEIIWLESKWPVISLGKVIEFVDVDIEKVEFKLVVFDPNINTTIKSIQSKIEPMDYKTFLCELENGLTVMAIAGLTQNGYAFWGYEEV